MTMTTTPPALLTERERASIVNRATYVHSARAGRDITRLFEHIDALSDAQTAAAQWQAEADRQADRAAFLDQEMKRLVAERDGLFDVVRVIGDSADLIDDDCDCVICQAYNRLPESVRDRLEAEAREGEGQ